jgi:predicted SnoaL-like aldol condensation-catalyzing enzyme
LAIFNRARNHQFKDFLMSAEVNLSIAYKWFDAFNQHNLEQLLSLYDDQAQHFSPKLKIRKPETNGFVIGKEAMREWWKDAFDRLPTLHYKVTSLTSNSDRVFMEYVRNVEGEEEMLVAEVLEIRDAKIILSRVYHG